MKIGILTHYYNSTNYGGSLQAYALCRVLEQMGHEAQQICIDHTRDCYNLTDNSRTARLKRLVGKPIKEGIKFSLRLFSPQERKAHAFKKQRHQALLRAFASFNQGMTPHSPTVYNRKTIRNCLTQYDAFITGSDQVWNPIWYFSPFFLDFVPGNKIKLAYAASIAQQTLPEHVQSVYREHLKDFTGISVREESAVSLLEGIAPGEVSCVLDPTFLLNAEDWSAICAPRQVAEPYVFCYFLDDDPHMRRAAAHYAKQHGLTLVTIPNAVGHLHVHDHNFGDVTMEDPSVEVFLSLIQHAQFVFSDSFHASVFSLIFQKQFITFSRKGHPAMNSRLTYLTDLFEVPRHFCLCAPEQYEQYVASLDPIAYACTPSTYVRIKQFSLDFLQHHLSGTYDNCS